MDLKEVIRECRDLQRRAYAPYSRYYVAAAVRGKNGQWFFGVNVENASFGATVCAERAALCQMVLSSDQRVDEVVVVTSKGAPPCGICLQCLTEFSKPEVPVHLVGEKKIETVLLQDLLPKSFRWSETQ